MTDVWTTHSLRGGELELLVLPGVAGRLWDIVFGGRSLLFQNADLVGLAVDLSALSVLPTRSPQFGFPLWGGEKTWIAPDSAWPGGAPHPVLDSGPYSVLASSETRIAMQSAICPISHLQITRTISLNAPASFTIEHEVANHGAAERKTGIWSVMMAKHPADILLGDARPDELTPVFGDHTPFFRRDREGVRFDCRARGEFKTGATAPSGSTGLLIGNGADRVLLSCAVDAIRPGDVFAHKHNVEVFNSGDYPYCEAEWHSPARDLGPGETMTFSQRFMLSNPLSPNPPM